LDESARHTIWTRIEPSAGGEHDRRPVNLLLLLYAMIAGLAGINAGPSAVARMAAVAQDGAVAFEARPIASQAEIAAKALVGNNSIERIRPVAVAVDARRVAATRIILALRANRRAAPERRLE
jgi:hypothetical protein